MAARGVNSPPTPRGATLRPVILRLCPVILRRCPVILRRCPVILRRCPICNITTNPKKIHRDSYVCSSRQARA